MDGNEHDITCGVLSKFSVEWDCTKFQFEHLLFSLVTDSIKTNIQDEVSWYMLFATAVILVRQEGKINLNFGRKHSSQMG